MNDFKSYSENNKGQNGGNSNGRCDEKGETKQNNAGNVDNTINLAQALAKAFSGKSEGQILQTIIAQAEQGKRNGTLTNDDLDNFYKTLAPLLDGFKRKKLAQIIHKLKAL
jgi:hypothetical protein